MRLVFHNRFYTKKHAKSVKLACFFYLPKKLLLLMFLFMNKCIATCSNYIVCTKRRKWVVMFKDNMLKNLLIINLFFLSLLLFSKMFFVHRLIRILFKSFLTPLIFSLFLFYIIKPLNTIFIKNGLKPSISALLTLILGLFIATGCITFFSNYIADQFAGTIEEITNIVKNQNSIN